MGIFGLVLSIILLLISSLIPCGKDDFYRYLCSSVKDENDKNGDKSNVYYFDNFLTYIVHIRDDLFPKDNEYRARRPKDIIIEIIFLF